MKRILIVTITSLLLLNCSILNDTQSQKKEMLPEYMQYVHLVGYYPKEKEMDIITRRSNKILKSAFEKLSKSVDLKKQKEFFVLYGLSVYSSYQGKIWNDSFTFTFLSNRTYGGIDVVNDSDIFDKYEPWFFEIIKMTKKWDTIQILDYSRKHQTTGSYFYDLIKITNTPKGPIKEELDLGQL
jgi:hypothetical protein